MKHIPMRVCVSCKKQFPKRELVRVVHTPDDDVVIDEKGKIPGRGAYVCKNQECLKTALVKNKLERSLKTKVAEVLKEQLAKQNRE